MALKRITMQDIADACSLSRNTVSKVFNDRGAVPEATRKLVLQKAQELGYFQLPEDVSAPESSSPEPSVPQPSFQNIALITARMPSEYHFAIIFLPAFTECLSRAGYTLMIYEVSPEELAANRLPSHLSLERTAGILGVEMFHRSYTEMLSTLGLPMLMVDSFSSASLSPLAHDLILMENQASTYTVVSRMISQGAKTLGFVGDVNHCCSFQERWKGFRLALENGGIPLDTSLCILDSDSEPYSEVDWVQAQLQKMPILPDAIFCANDFLAIRLVAALKRMGRSIPRDIMVAGFDNSPQSSLLDPSLTTVSIPSTQLGRIAAELLLSRIRQPDRPFCTTYVRTSPVWRGSTNLLRRSSAT